ncbi:MAG: hypothetical protein V3R73_05980 [Sphingomonadales bacterium]
MRTIAIAALLLAIFGDVTPGAGHLTAIVGSLLAALAFPGAPWLATLAIVYNMLAVTIATPQFVFYDLMNLGEAIDRTVGIDPVPWQLGLHFLALIVGIKRYWERDAWHPQ